MKSLKNHKGNRGDLQKMWAVKYTKDFAKSNILGVRKEKEVKKFGVAYVFTYLCAALK
jgi:hypothetical protein